MRYLLGIFVLVMVLATGCAPEADNKRSLDPSLELGQVIKFLGSSPEKTYIIVGYRQQYGGSVSKDYTGQEYITFIYINDLNEVKEGTVHMNSIVKY